MERKKFGIKDYIMHAISIKEVLRQYAPIKELEKPESFFTHYYKDENDCLRSICWFCGANGEYNLALNHKNDTFKCHGCKIEGTMIDYVMAVEQCDEKTAMKNIIESLELEDDVPKRFLKELE